MTTDVTPPAPSAQTTYSKSGRVGRAWAEAWRLMDAEGDTDGYVDGIWLATQAAAISDLSPETMKGVLSRQAKAGLLERVHETLSGSRGPRKRTFYRIAR